MYEDVFPTLFHIHYTDKEQIIEAVANEMVSESIDDYQKDQLVSELTHLMKRRKHELKRLILKRYYMRLAEHNESVSVEEQVQPPSGLESMSIRELKHQISLLEDMDSSSNASDSTDDDRRRDRDRRHRHRYSRHV